MSLTIIANTSIYAINNDNDNNNDDDDLPSTTLTSSSSNLTITMVIHPSLAVDVLLLITMI
jgi:hypothetical protein